MTLITTVIPVFDRAQVVGRAIESVLAQELPAGCSLRVIVVDDGSADDLAGALQRFGANVRCIRHPQNAGASAARNTGIAAADAGSVAFLDSDDVWLPGKLKVQIETMQHHQWVASCTAFHLGRAGRPDIVSPWYPTGTLGLADLAWGCFVGPGATLVCARSVFDEIGVLDTSLLRLEDWDWLLRYGEKYALGFIAQPLARTVPSDRKRSPDVLAALDTLRRKHANRLSGGPERGGAPASAGRNRHRACRDPLSQCRQDRDDRAAVALDPALSLQERRACCGPA
jgi:glycosyltransferase involved in cell wall biosynthesis